MACTVLVADDREDVRTIVRDEIVEAGAVVVEAADGEEAWAHFLYLGADARRAADPGHDRAGWEIGDDGIRFSLPGSPPKLSRTELETFFTDLVGDGWQREIGALCVQPAEAWILDAVERALDLAPPAIESSRAVMRSAGSLVSATLGFVLEHEILHAPAGERGVILGHRPGFAMEGWRFERGTGRLSR